MDGANTRMEVLPLTWESEQCVTGENLQNSFVYNHSECTQMHMHENEPEFNSVSLQVDA